MQPVFLSDHELQAQFHREEDETRSVAVRVGWGALWRNVDAIEPKLVKTEQDGPPWKQLRENIRIVMAEHARDAEKFEHLQRDWKWLTDELSKMTDANEALKAKCFFQEQKISALAQQQVQDRSRKDKHGACSVRPPSGQ